MSELKTFRIKEVEDGCPFWQAEYEVYSRDEVNKVIAELEENHKNEVGQLLDSNREQAVNANWLRESMKQVIRRQKFKRCVAMTKWCFAKANFHYIIGRKEGGQFAKDNFRRGNLYSKWCDRWKKLAEQFKEAK